MPPSEQEVWVYRERRGEARAVATLSTVMTIYALAVRRSSRWWPRFLAMDGCEFSPAVSSAGDHSLSGGCLREAVGLSVGDHGGKQTVFAGR